VLFGTPGVPPGWHGDAVHARAVALAPHNYRCIRLHRGRIGGPFAGNGGIAVQRTRYFDFSRELAWRGLRVIAWPAPAPARRPSAAAAPAGPASDPARPPCPSAPGSHHSGAVIPDRTRPRAADSVVVVTGNLPG